MARPRGSARGSVSAILEIPELAEKRTVTGTSCLKCNALLTLAASALGTNLPSRTTPLAWADRCVVCLPNAEFSASTNDSGVVAIAGSFRVFIASSVGTIPSSELRTEGPSVQARPRCVVTLHALMSAWGQERTFASQTDYTRTLVTGRNLTTAMSAIRMKIANTAACVIANGGSDCVGANTLSAKTFMKLCATKTKTFR